MDESKVLDTLVEMVKTFRADQNRDSFLAYKDPAALSKVLGLESESGNEDWSQIFQWIEKYLTYCVKTNHKGFVNRMWVGGNLPSIIGEIIAAVSNTSSCTYESAPVSTLMEKFMIGQMLDLVGFHNGEGQMTTGSSNANMLAMMIARNQSLDTVKSQGLYNQPVLIGFVSADAHYSMEKAANIIGIGTDHLVKIPVNTDGEMDMVILSRELEKTTAAKAIPFFVGSTAGTTVRGAYDSIPDLLKLREKYHFWLHVDGAWGGAVLVSDRLRHHFMKEIEYVDSLTWDFHKMLGTSLMCNIFMVNNHPHTFGQTFTSGDDSYIFHTHENEGLNVNDVHDLGAVSLQCGRRVDSLKWFLDWKYYGKKGFASRVEHALELCEYAASTVSESDRLELVWPRSSFNICFRYKTQASISNDVNLAIRKTLYHKGDSLVGYAYENNRVFLRLLLAGPDLTFDDIDHYFDTVIQTGRSIESRYRT